MFEGGQEKTRMNETTKTTPFSLNFTPKKSHSSLLRDTRQFKTCRRKSLSPTKDPTYAEVGYRRDGTKRGTTTKQKTGSWKRWKKKKKQR